MKSVKHTVSQFYTGFTAVSLGKRYRNKQRKHRTTVLEILQSEILHMLRNIIYNCT